MEITVHGINSFLIEGAKLLLDTGISRTTRGFNCVEIPEPITIKFINPRSRVVTIQERKWNPFLPFAESLWIAMGSNSLSLPGQYVQRLTDYSDDGIYMRAGYGPRLRCYNGSTNDYRVDSGIKRHLQTNSIDQLKYVIDVLQKDRHSRRAIVTLGDPNKDCYTQGDQLKETLDFPCTRSLQFIVTEERLNMITYMRSNDFLLGASAVNIFNFTLMQEYVAGILNIPIGNYYHVVGNLHFYEQHTSTITKLSNVTSYDLDTSYNYKVPTSIDEFDSSIDWLQNKQAEISNSQKPYAGEALSHKYDLIADWVNVFRSCHDGKVCSIQNPYLGKAVDMKLSNFK